MGSMLPYIAAPWIYGNEPIKRTGWWLGQFPSYIFDILCNIIISILLVVSNINFIFHHIWDVILPIDELIFFKMVKTTNQNKNYEHYARIHG